MLVAILLALRAWIGSHGSTVEPSVLAESRTQPQPVGTRGSDERREAIEQELERSPGQSDWRAALYRILVELSPRGRLGPEYAAFAASGDRSGVRLLLDELKSLRLPSDEPRVVELLNAMLAASPCPQGIEQELYEWTQSAGDKRIQWLPCRVLLAQGSTEGKEAVARIIATDYDSYLAHPGTKGLLQLQGMLTELRDHQIPQALPLCSDIIGKAADVPEAEDDDSQSAEVDSDTGRSTQRGRNALARRAFRVVAAMQTPESIAVLKQSLHPPAPTVTQGYAWGAVESVIEHDLPAGDAYSSDFQGILTGSDPITDYAQFSAAMTWVAQSQSLGIPELLALSRRLDGASPECRGAWERCVAQIAARTGDPGALDEVRVFERSSRFPTARSDPNGRVRASVTEALSRYGSTEDVDHITQRALNGDTVVADSLLKSAPATAWGKDLGRLDSLLRRYENSEDNGASNTQALAYSLLIGLTDDPESCLSRYSDSENYRGKNLSDRLRVSREFSDSGSAVSEEQLRSFIVKLRNCNKETLTGLLATMKAWVRGGRLSVEAVQECLGESGLPLEYKVILLRELVCTGSSFGVEDLGKILEYAAPSLQSGRWARDYWCLLVVYMSRDREGWPVAGRILSARISEATLSDPSLDRALLHLREFLDKYG